jgi:hypothetical protein
VGAEGVGVVRSGEEECGFACIGETGKLERDGVCAYEEVFKEGWGDLPLFVWLFGKGRFLGEGIAWRFFFCKLSGCS